jgi:hypothetical protein
VKEKRTPIDILIDRACGIPNGLQETETDEIVALIETAIHWLKHKPKLSMADRILAIKIKPLIDRGW